MNEWRRFLPILAAAGLLIGLHQALDLASAAHALDFALPSDRMRLVALIGSRGPALLSADLFLVVASVGLSPARVISGLAVLHVAAGAVLLAVAVNVLTDAGRLAVLLAPGDLTAYRISVARMLIALALLGVGSLFAAGALRRISRGLPQVSPIRG